MARMFSDALNQGDCQMWRLVSHCSLSHNSHSLAHSINYSHRGQTIATIAVKKLRLRAGTVTAGALRNPEVNTGASSKENDGFKGRLQMWQSLKVSVRSGAVLVDVSLAGCQPHCHVWSLSSVLSSVKRLSLFSFLFSWRRSLLQGPT